VQEIQAHRLDYNRTHSSAHRRDAAPVSSIEAQSNASTTAFTAAGLEACITKAIGAGVTLALEQMQQAPVRVTAPNWPIQDANVPKSFRIGAQTRADEAWRLYFNCSVSGGSPLRFVTCDMLPQGPQLKSQKVALSRLKKVCQVILGKTDPNLAAQNSESYFLTCYKRFNEILQFPETWSISYIYDQMHKPNKAGALKVAMQSTAFGASEVHMPLPTSPSLWKQQAALPASQQLLRLPVAGRRREYQQLPADYKVPCLKIRDSWDCWFHGSSSSPPLKDIQTSSSQTLLRRSRKHDAKDASKPYIFDGTWNAANVKAQATALSKCLACIEALNPLGVCDLCILSNSEQYFNDGCSKLQEEVSRSFPGIDIRNLSTNYLYDKVMFCQKRKRASGIDGLVSIVPASLPVSLPGLATAGPAPLPLGTSLPVAKRSRYVAPAP
jgi:hypothetical protein